MTELLQIGILPLLLTLAAYQIGLLCQRKFRSPICNPILIAVILVLIFLHLTDTAYADYKQGTSFISWLMTPATVCLAIPMYEQLQILRKNFPYMLVGIAAGAVSCLALVLVFGMVCRFAPELLISLLPKSVTAAIGVPLSEMSGGVAAITTTSISLTGITASVLGPTFCKWLRITHPVAQGVAMGTSGHVIATAKATEMSELAGAAGSLSLVVAGLLTSVIFPMLIQFFL